jgi:hypothetical protein
MRWRLIIEEYSPELIYLKGEHNIVADALSRLELISPENQQENQQNNHDMHYLADHFGLEDDDLPVDAYPLQLLLNINVNKQILFPKLKNTKGFKSNPFVEAERSET